MCTQKAPFKTEPLNNAVFANSEARSHIDASQNAQEHKTILEPTQEKLLPQPPSIFSNKSAFLRFLLLFLIVSFLDMLLFSKGVCYV